MDEHVDPQKDNSELVQTTEGSGKPTPDFAQALAQDHSEDFSVSQNEVEGMIDAAGELQNKAGEDVNMIGADPETLGEQGESPSCAPASKHAIDEYTKRQY